MAQFLDIARGAYAKLPYRARSQIGTVLKYLPARYRYGATYQTWRDRLVDTARAPETLKRLQDKARVDVVSAAYAHSPFYREQLTRAFGTSFDPASALNDSMWSQIPLLDPETVVDNRQALCTRPSNELDRGSTGGTSGKPVQFFLDKGRAPVEYAFVFDAWSRCGFQEGDWRAVFRGVEVNEAGTVSIEKDPALAEMRFSIFHLTDAKMQQFHDEIIGMNIEFLHGYPSAIGMFASYLIRAGLAPMHQIRGVMLMGERLYPNYREMIETAFPSAKLVPFFGLSEKCAFAVEVEDMPDTYDFHPLYGYTELLDENNRPVTEVGQRGRIVSTGLIWKGMPFLRYNTRDEATLIERPSAENGYRLRLQRIVPRRGHEFLVSKANRLIPILGPLVFGNEMLTIKEFQFYQDTPGKAVMKVVSRSGERTPEVSDYVALINRKMEGQLELSHEFVEALPVSPRAKRRFIDQRLDVAAIERSMNLSPDAVAHE